MKIEIKSWVTGSVILEAEADSLRVALQVAVGKRADLHGADLQDANLLGADLRGAGIDTGETLAEYIRDVVPVLCMAGGKPLAEVAAAWDCHSWENCPMAVAFGVKGIEDVPAFYRPRARQFVQFFDARLIPRPETGEPLAQTCGVLGEP